jgi:hypothetical protein
MAYIRVGNDVSPYEVEAHAWIAAVGMLSLAVGLGLYHHSTKWFPLDPKDNTFRNRSE